jgi:hypothetical protein
MIKKGKKYVPVYEKVYKYKFVKAKGKNKFQRKIVHVRQKLKVPCAKQCVKMAKKKGKLRPVYVVRKKKVLVPRHGVLRKVKKRIRTYAFAKCPKSATSLGTPVTITVLDGSKAKLDFGAFVREAPVTGAGNGLPDHADQRNHRSGPDAGVHRRRLQRAGLLGDPDRQPDERVAEQVEDVDQHRPGQRDRDGDGEHGRASAAGAPQRRSRMQLAVHHDGLHRLGRDVLLEGEA